MHTCHSPLGRGRSVEHDRVPSLVGLPWTEKLEAGGLTAWEVESQWPIPGSRAVRGGAAGGGESQGRSQVSPVILGLFSERFPQAFCVSAWPHLSNLGRRVSSLQSALSKYDPGRYPNRRDSSADRHEVRTPLQVGGVAGGNRAGRQGDVSSGVRGSSTSRVLAQLAPSSGRSVRRLSPFGRPPAFLLPFLPLGRRASLSNSPCPSVCPSPQLSAASVCFLRSTYCRQSSAWFVLVSRRGN